MTMTTWSTYKFLYRPLSIRQIQRIYRTYFTTKDLPAREFIGVASLLRGGHFEMQAIAVRGKPARRLTNCRTRGWRKLRYSLSSYEMFLLLGFLGACHFVQHSAVAFRDSCYYVPIYGPTYLTQLGIVP